MLKFLLTILCLLSFQAAALADVAPADNIQVKVQKDGDSVVIDLSATIPATPQEAWSVLVDFDHMPQFLNNLQSSKILEKRGNHWNVAALADPLHPAVLCLIERTARAAGAAGKRTAVCGELAGDPMAVALLLGLGVTELSLLPAQIPLVKQAVRATHLGEARELARAALGAASAADVRRLCAEA